MMKLTTGPELLEHLRSAFAEQRYGRFAVAFWGNGASTSLGIRKGDDVKAICNLATGGTNPMEIEQLIKADVEVRKHSELHAKIGIVGDVSFVGSSNMSTNGLGDEGAVANGWEEANVIFQGDPLGTAERFDNLWTSSEKITDEDIIKAKTAWHANRTKNARISIGQGGTSLLNEMRNNAAKLDRSRVFVVIAPDATDEEMIGIDQVNDDLQQEFGDDFEVYLDWPDLPKDAFLIGLRKPSRGKMAFDGLYLRSADIDDRELDGSTYEIVKEIDEICGLRAWKAERSALRTAAQKCWLEKSSTEREGFCVSVTEFAKFLD